jgi:hypothetical protein
MLKPKGSMLLNCKTLLAAITAMVVIASTLPVQAQNFFQSIGGIRIDASGTIANQTREMQAATLEWLRKNMSPVAGEMKNHSNLRIISLRQMESAINQAISAGQPIPDEIKYMAGMQRIEFVFAADDDVLIAGPAEGWVVNNNGIVVGKNSGRPVLHLEDFVTALQTVEDARTDYGITVSIDPTAEGVKNLNQLYSKVGRFTPQTAKAAEEAMGPQVISLTGVPTTSRFAQILVAADYQMKRLAMGFETAPVSEMPSLMEMAAANPRKAPKRITPRFWMECNYNPVGRSEDGKAFHLTGPAVKALTEEQAIATDGENKPKSKAHPMAQKWAQSMTDKFEELAAKEVVFGELRNIMDMSVIAALIAHENLLEKTNLELPAMLGKVKSEGWNSPKTVPAQCSYVDLGSSMLATVSGGIVLDSWSVAEKTIADTKVAAYRGKAIAAKSDQWWWDAIN